MKLPEFKQWIFEKETGTYAGLRFSKETNDKIIEFCRKFDIPNSIEIDKIHTTLLYSKKYLPKYESLDDADSIENVKFKKFHKFGDCLVMLLDAPEIEQRHKDLMEEHNATWDYPEYSPHITLSYNDEGYYNTKNGYNHKPDEFELFFKDFEFVVIEEYKEDLDLDWKETNGN